MSGIVVLYHRVVHALWRAGVPALPRVLAALGRFLFHCYIGPGARLGKRVSLGYGGLGTVIHGGAVVGDDVRIGNGVVIGGRSKLREVPVIGERCVISAGAMVLGPLRIGEESVVGANAVVVHDVPARSVVAGVPARVIKSGIDIRAYHDGLEAPAAPEKAEGATLTFPSSPARG